MCTHPERLGKKEKNKGFLWQMMSIHDYFLSPLAGGNNCSKNCYIHTLALSKEEKESDSALGKQHKSCCCCFYSTSIIQKNWPELKKILSAVALLWLDSLQLIEILAKWQPLWRTVHSYYSGYSHKTKKETSVMGHFKDDDANWAAHLYAMNACTMDNCFPISLPRMSTSKTLHSILSNQQISSREKLNFRSYPQDLSSMHCTSSNILQKKK